MTQEANKLKLIVGLGNPEPRYWETRHNAGFWIVDRIATKYSVNLQHKKDLFADTTKVSIGRQEVVLAKPTTYMNLSGRSIAAFLHWFKIDPVDLLIIHDEVALPLGKIRMQHGGGAGGHHGIESTFESIGKDKVFDRLRIGVGPDPGGDIRGHFVLSPIDPEDRELKEKSLAMATDAVYMWLARGHKDTANKFNGMDLRPKPPDPEPSAPPSETPAPEPSAPLSETPAPEAAPPPPTPPAPHSNDEPPHHSDEFPPP